MGFVAPLMVFINSMKSPAARASCRDWCVVGLALSLETAVVLSTWISLVARDARNSGNGNILRGRATAHPSNTEACYSFRFCESHSHFLSSEIE